MRVLITCHNGDIGSVLAPLVRGTPWRPLVHIEHIARAFIGALHAPGELVHNEAFHPGRREENYRVRDLGSLVGQIVPGSSLRYAEGGGPDPRCYPYDGFTVAMDTFKDKKHLDELYAKGNAP